MSQLVALHFPRGWPEMMPIILAGKLGAVFRRLSPEHDEAAASVNEVFKRMNVPYRLRSVD